MDIIELIEKGVACWISERGRDQILSRIQSMQELCDIVSDLDNIIPGNRGKLIKAIAKYQESKK